MKSTTLSQPWPQNLGRRDFLLAAGVGVGSLLLPGCGGGGGTGISSTTVFAGTVDRAQFGAEALAVSSGYGPLATVSGDGTFSTPVLANGVQLVAVVNQTGATRGLLTVMTAGQLSSRTINTLTTAQSMVFASPGIYVSDPVSAAMRLKQISRLSAYPPLANYLTANLVASTLDSISQSPDLQSKLEACVAEWGATFAGTSHRSATASRSAKIGPSAASELYFTVEMEGHPSPTTIKMENWAWRCVKVIRRDMDGNRQLRAVTVVENNDPIMGGAVPVSWGGVFSWPPLSDVGNPYVRHDSPDFGPSSAASAAEYYIIGPGRLAGSDTIPPGVDGNLATVYGVSILSYIVFPVIGFLLGLSDDPTSWLSAASSVWEAMGDGVDLGKLIKDAGSSTFARSLKEVVADTLRLVVSSKVLLNRGLITKFMQAALEEVIAWGSGVIAAGNLYMAIDSWKRHPLYLRVPVSLTGGTVITVG